MKPFAVWNFKEKRLPIMKHNRAERKRSHPRRSSDSTGMEADECYTGTDQNGVDNPSNAPE